MQLDRCSEHYANSQDEDSSKYLKHEQIVSVADAVTLALQLQCSSRPLNATCSLQKTRSSILSHSYRVLLRCMQRVVRALRAQLTVKQLEGFNIHSSFGSFTRFSANRGSTGFITKRLQILCQSSAVNSYRRRTRRSMNFVLIKWKCKSLKHV